MKRLVATALASMFLAACGPQFELVGVQAKESFGLDYKVHVDCQVKNNGKEGEVTVEAELSKGGWWKKSKVENVYGGETKTVRVTFSEITFLDGGLQSGEYKCRISN